MAPLCWAIAVIFYRKTQLPAVSMNLFKNTVAIGLLSLTMWALGVHVPTDRAWVDWFRLVASGVIGLSIADTLLFEGLRRVGAAQVAVVDTVYAPLMVLLSWLFLAEQPAPTFLLGGVAVIGGVSLASLDVRAAFVKGDREGMLGMLFVLGSIVGTASGVILSKPVLEQSDLFEVTWTRLVAGTIALGLWTTLRREWGEASVAFRPQLAWKTLLPGTLFGTYLSLLFWLGGFKWGDASVAAVLNQLATVYILVLARTLLGETLGRRQIAGASLAVVGAVVIVATR
jgi:drug/metabolite transporter (DMT)-like permease